LKQKDEAFKKYVEKILEEGLDPYDAVGKELGLGAQKMGAIFGTTGSEFSDFLLKTLWGLSVKIDDEKAKRFEEIIKKLPDGLMREFSLAAVEKAKMGKKGGRHLFTQPL